LPARDLERRGDWVSFAIKTSTSFIFPQENRVFGLRFYEKRLRARMLIVKRKGGDPEKWQKQSLPLSHAPFLLDSPTQSSDWIFGILDVTLIPASADFNG
jgi:hypothetical protein